MGFQIPQILYVRVRPVQCILMYASYWYFLSVSLLSILVLQRRWYQIPGRNFRGIAPPPLKSHDMRLPVDEAGHGSDPYVQKDGKTCFGCETLCVCTTTVYEYEGN